MKKILIGLILLFALFLNASVSVKIVSHRADSVILSIDNTAKQTNIFTDYIYYENEKLPYYHFNLIIPDFSDIDLRYQVQDTLYVNDFEYGYSDTLFKMIPADAIVCSKPYIFRNFRGVEIKYFPYHKIDNDVLFLNKINLQISFNPKKDADYYNLQHKNIPLFFDNVYQRFFINYSYFEPDNITTEKAIVINMQDSQSGAERLVTDLTYRGIKNELYTYPTDTGTGDFALKNFISALFASNDDFTFLIFVSQDAQALFNSYSPFILGDDDLPELVSANLVVDENTVFASDERYLLNFDFSDFYPTEDDLSDLITFNSDKENLINFYKGDNYKKGYCFVSDNLQYNNLYEFSHDLINSKEDYFFSEIPFLYSLIHQIDIKNFCNPTIRINKLKQNNINPIFYFNSYNPIDFNVSVYLNDDTHKIPVSIVANDNVLDSKYTDDYGNTDFTLENNNDISFLKVITYSKLSGENIEFITLASDKTTAIKDTISNLLTVYPNPFYPQKNKAGLTISFELKNAAFVNVTVYNIAGQLIKTICSGSKGEGTVNIKWDGKDNRGKPVATGVYYIMVKIDNKTEISKVMIIK